MNAKDWKLQLSILAVAGTLIAASIIYPPFGKWLYKHTLSLYDPDGARNSDYNH